MNNFFIKYIALIKIRKRLNSVIPAETGIQYIRITRERSYSDFHLSDESLQVCQIDLILNSYGFDNRSDYVSMNFTNGIAQYY